MHGASSKLGVAIVAAVAFGVSTALPGSAQVARPPTGLVNGELGAQIDEYLTRAAAFGFAAAVLIAKDGQTALHKGYGLANRERDIPITGETVFDIGSITKGFTAAAILKLEEQGRLRVTDLITRHFADVPPDKAGITINHLLTHSAGLKDAFGDDYEVMPRDSLVQLALHSELLWAPGLQYRYSNAGYSLLAAIVEKVSDQPYEAFLRDAMFEPAGMTQTGYRLPDWPEERLAHGYLRDQDWGTPLDKPWAEDGPYWNLRGNGGLLSTVGDLYRWHLALAGVTVLSRESREKMFTPRVPENEERTSFYGYGWAITSTSRGTNLVWHDGGNGFFFADFRRYVNEDVVLIFATNEGLNRQIERRIVRLLFGRADDVERLPVARLELSESQLARYAGGYRLPSGLQFEVTVRHGQLVIPARDLEVSAIFVPSPQLDAATRARLEGIDDVTSTVVAGMAAGDFTLFQKEFIRIGEIDIEGEIEFWTGAFQFWTDRFGPFTGSKVLGSALGFSDFGPTLDTYVLLRFEEGERIISFRQSTEGSASGFYLDAIPSTALPAAHRFVPLSETEFATFNFEFAEEARIRFEFDAEDRIGALRVFDGRGDVVARKTGSR
jgi:CubicO group peptidase (beta-lactamase class C family)